MAMPSRRRVLLALVLSLEARAFHGPLTTSRHRVRRATLQDIEAFVQDRKESAQDRAELDAMVRTLPNAVDAVRALDLETALVGTSTFASALETIAESAPAAACGALVGHAIARLKRRPDAAAACMDDRVLSPLASALAKARSNRQALTAIEAITGDKSARDYRVGIVTAARLNDANKVKSLLSTALKKQKLMARRRQQQRQSSAATSAGQSDDDDDREEEESASASEEEKPSVPAGPLEQVDEGTLRFALKVLAKNGDYRTPFAVIEGLPVERRSVPLYHAAITACSKSRPPKGRTAMILWKKMKTQGFRDKIPRATYNALLNCAQGAAPDDTDNHGDRANANATTAILREMKSRGISLNVVSYNIALKSLADAGRFSEILDLLDRMESSNIVPTAVTFGTAIHGAAVANNSAAALALLRADIKHCGEHNKPADAVFGAALEACVRDPDASQAAAAARAVVNIMCDIDVDLERRERIEQLARAALHRGVLDDDRVNRAEDILGMALHNRRLEV